MLRSINMGTKIVLLLQQRRGLSGLFALAGASKKKRFQQAGCSPSMAVSTDL
jgi:hypothetical protein